MMPDRQRVDRHEGTVPNRCNSQTVRWSVLSGSNNVLMLLCNIFSLLFLESYFIRNPLDNFGPPLSDSPHVMKSPRPSFSIFVYCKYWRWQRPGNEAEHGIWCVKWTSIISKVKMDTVTHSPWRGIYYLLTSTTAFSLGLTADRQTDRQTDRKTDRWTDRQYM